MSNEKKGPSRYFCNDLRKLVKEKFPNCYIITRKEYGFLKHNVFLMDSETNSTVKQTTTNMEMYAWLIKDHKPKQKGILSPEEKRSIEAGEGQFKDRFYKMQATVEDVLMDCQELQPGGEVGVVKVVDDNGGFSYHLTINGKIVERKQWR